MHLLTLGFSPLAFVLLGLALLALFLGHPKLNRQALAVGAAGLAAAGLQIAALVEFPTPGLVYPYGTWRLLAGLVVAGLGAALAFSGKGGWPLASIFLVWASATIVADLVPSPVGHNLVRASVFVVPLVLVAAALADFRPRWLTIAAVAAAVASNVLPYAAMISTRSSSVDSRSSFWRPIVDFLHAHSGPGYRVEVVPTANHWEAYYIPRAGLALARGWYRQLDIADDPVLYASRLTGASYGTWLRAHAVRYVILPHLALEAIDARREAALIESGAAGLRTRLDHGRGDHLRTPPCESMLTGPARAAVTAIGSSEIDGWVARPGSYHLRVHFTPYWAIVSGSICLTRASGSMTRLEAARPGPFTIRAIETPAGVLTTILDQDHTRCPNASKPRL